MLPILRHAFTRRIFATLLFELVALVCSFALLIQLRLELWLEAKTHATLTIAFAVSATIVVQFALWSFGLYSREVVYSGQRLVSNLFGALIFSAALLYPTCYLFNLTGVGVFTFTIKFYVIALLAFSSVIALERLLILRVFEDTTYLGDVLVLGTGPVTERLAAEANDDTTRAFTLGGILSEKPDEVGTEIHGHRVVGTMSDYSRIAASNPIQTVVISSSVYAPELPVDALLRAKTTGTHVIDAGEFFEKHSRKVLLEKLDRVSLLLSDNLRMTRFRWFLKDSMEKLVAIALLVATSPIMLLAAIGTKLTSKGPIFYTQIRAGQHGDRFKVIKFRTMAVDAELDGKPQWAQKNDPRVTWIGRIMRKTRIDELPQIFNVLAGEMAFVGPRPERPEFVESLSKEIPFFDQRHLVKPGITGWAQVCYPYGASVEDAREKLRYDLYYIKHMSIFFDMMIVLATVRTVLFKAYGR